MPSRAPASVELELLLNQTAVIIDVASQMSLIADEKSIPRTHLIGTLLIVLVLTLALGGFFSWQNLREHELSFARIEQTTTDQLKAR